MDKLICGAPHIFIWFNFKIYYTHPQYLTEIIVYSMFKYLLVGGVIYV